MRLPTTWLSGQVDRETAIRLQKRTGGTHTFSGGQIYLENFPQTQISASSHLLVFPRCGINRPCGESFYSQAGGNPRRYILQEHIPHLNVLGQNRFMQNHDACFRVAQVAKHTPGVSRHETPKTTEISTLGSSRLQGKVVLTFGTGLSPPLVAMKLSRSTRVTTPVMTVIVLYVPPVYDRCSVHTRAKWSRSNQRASSSKGVCSPTWAGVFRFVLFVRSGVRITNKTKGKIVRTRE